MAVLPPGYHIKCNFCDKTEGPFPSVQDIENLILSKDAGWMEIRTGGEEFHCCGSDHFEWPASGVIEKLFKEQEEQALDTKQASRARLINRGF